MSRVFITLFSCLICLPALAGAAGDEMHGIVVLGKASSGFSGSAAEGWGERNGLSAGGYVSQELASGVEFVIGALFNQKGGLGWYMDYSGYSHHGLYELDYLDIPVMLRLFAPSSVSPYLQFGPTIDLPVSTKFALDMGGGVLERVDVGDMIPDAELSLAIGGGLCLGPVLIDVAYSIGMTRVFDYTEWTGVERSWDIKNSLLTVSGGVRFGAGG